MSARLKHCKWLLRSAILTVLIGSCAVPSPQANLLDQAQNQETIAIAPSPEATAAVTAVEAIAQDPPNTYTFSVTVRSPDTGCDRYADWWEVVSEDGDLLYRRILAHSHVDEQPFTRSGGPVMIEADQIVIVRVHMNPTGYASQAMQGSVSNGFESAALPPIASELVEAEPQPKGCAF